MGNADSKREKNYQEYLRLKNNPDYTDVTFDEQSGGVSAVHKEHCFDKQKGPFGCKRGQYEYDVANVLRYNGYLIILDSEYPKGKGVKSYDATIDGLATEIKTVETGGRWSIRKKIHDAIDQGAEILVLYYPDGTKFSPGKITEGLILNESPEQLIPPLEVLVIKDGGILKMSKPPG